MSLKDSNLRFPVLMLGGAVFGMALQRGRVHEAMAVIDQMTFSRFIMLKMFLSASGTSAIALGLADTFAPPENRTGKNFKELFGRGLLATAVGASIVGVGMTLSGSCPGTVFAQLGAGSTTAWYVLLGGLTGSFLFSQFERVLADNQYTFLTAKKLDGEATSFRRKLRGVLPSIPDKYYPYVIGASLLGIVAGLEFIRPWRTDLQSIIAKDGSPITWVIANPPIVSGMAIGLVQLPFQYLLGRYLGSSSSYGCLVGNVFPSLTGSSATINSCRVNSSWQPFVMMGAVAGAFISSSLSGVSYASDGYISTARAFAGGLISVFGAHIAGGCTSGHGISGLGFQSTYSLVAVACMFGSAIATGVALAL